LFACIARTF